MVELLQQARDQRGPAGLMARPAAASRVAVKVLVEEDQIAPVRVALEAFARAGLIDAPPAVTGSSPGPANSK